MIRKTCLCLLCVLLIVEAFSQDREYVEVGKPFPDYTLKNMLHYPKTEENVSALKGKFVILDFFNKGCAACVKAWPHTKEIQELYKGRLNILLVGAAQKPADIEPTKNMYERFRKQLKLDFPVSFDYTLYHRFGIQAGPIYVWIDDNGITQAITSTDALHPKNIDSFLAGRKFKFNQAGGTDINRLIGLNLYKPLLLNNNGGVDSSFISRSVLYDFNPGTQQYWFPPISAFVTDPGFKGLFQFQGWPLAWLYKSAYWGICDVSDADPDKSSSDQPYYGKYDNNVIFNLSDSTFLYLDPVGKTERLYGYSFSYPPGRKNVNEDFLQRNLQLDLVRTFGYQVRVESRMRPYLKLVANAQAKKNLPTKFKENRIISGGQQADIEEVCAPISKLIFRLASYGTTKLPVVDMTGITSNIDLKLKCIWVDFNDVKRALNKIGLDLVEDQRPMKVLVVSDGE